MKKKSVVVTSLEKEKVVLLDEDVLKKPEVDYEAIEAERLAEERR